MFFKYHLDEIKAAANYLDKNIHSSIICFDGPMGAGKTTLISALCSEWNVKDQVSSPTFSIVNEYETYAKDLLFHFDYVFSYIFLLNPHIPLIYALTVFSIQHFLFLILHSLF